MAKQLQLRKGSTADHSTFVGAVAELSVNTETGSLLLHDGVTAGGHAVAMAVPVANALAGKEDTSNKGVANGYASLDATGLVPLSQLPAAATGGVASVVATTPLTYTGTTDVTISIPAATALVNGYMTSTYASKLDGIAANANNYVLPVASATLGGVKSGTDITVDASGNVSVNDNSHAHTIANVTGLQTALDGKVDDSQVLTNVPAGAVFTDTVYTHPTTDGNLHVPANGTTNSGKVLTAGATAGVYTWETPTPGVTDHTLLSNIGTNTHAQIDTHIADATKHRVINDTSTTTTDLWSASKISTSLAGKSDTSHTHAGVYEPAFTKNTGFNKDFGTTAGTVSEGNHTHDYLPLSGGTVTGVTTFSARPVCSAGIEVGDGTSNTAGVRFEGGKHSISNNDGGGNFNIRVGNDFTTGCTEAGYTGHQSFSQGTGTWEFNVSTASLLVGNTPTWNTLLSMSNTAFTYLGNTIWHAGNDGSGSGLDADTVDGYNAVMSSYSANEIPVRDGSGDIHARLFRSNYAEQATVPATTADICFRNSTTDNYMRFMSSTAFASWCSSIGVGGGTYRSQAIIQDQKGSASYGGGISSGAWVTRTLNTIVSDPDGIVSLASNVITLQAGTYYVQFGGPAYDVAQFLHRFRATDDSIIIYGTFCNSNTTYAGQSIATGEGTFTIATAKTFDLQVRVVTTNTNATGLGTTSSFGQSYHVFGSVTIWKV